MFAVYDRFKQGIANLVLSSKINPYLIDTTKMYWYTGGGVPDGTVPEGTTSLGTSEAPVAGKESSRCGARGADLRLALRLLGSPGLSDSARRMACSNRPALPRDRGLTSTGSSSSMGGMSSSTSSKITTRGISKWGGPKMGHLLISGITTTSMPRGISGRFTKRLTRTCVRGVRVRSIVKPLLT